jgi:hypothetical protein
MTWQESGDMRLGITLIDEGEWTLITQVRGETGWEPAATAGFRALEQLVPTEAGPDFLAGALPGLRWHTHISPEAGGFWLETVAQVEQHIELNPAMIRYSSRIRGKIREKHNKRCGHSPFTKHVSFGLTRIFTPSC